MAPKQSFPQAFAMVVWTLLACLAWPPSTAASRHNARGARCLQSYGVAVQCNQVHNGATWNERAAR
jgi:hypothetical protein